MMTAIIYICTVNEKEELHKRHYKTEVFILHLYTNFVILIEDIETKIKKNIIHSRIIHIKSRCHLLS